MQKMRKTHYHIIHGKSRSNAIYAKNHNFENGRLQLYLAIFMVVQEITKTVFFMPFLQFLYTYICK